MKNIHILTTNKPSRLFIDIDDTRLKITQPIGGEHMMNQHIYITSDEEIGEGDWYLDTTVNVIFKNDKLFLNGTGYKKIILSTNQELIADNVQAIDDDFLEWFVKNPSCEYVETLYGLLAEYSDIVFYEIIIPKEEPKQETLEEAADNYAEKWEEITGLCWEDSFPQYVNRIDFIAGAKWQQERSYSEEEVKELLSKFHIVTDGTKKFEDKWFNKIKKK